MEAKLKKPFIVTQIEQEDFFSFKAPVRLRDIHWLNFGRAEEKDTTTGASRMVHYPDEVWARYTLSNSEPWIKMKLAWRGTPLAASNPVRMYDGPIPLNPAKVKDLQTMAKKHVPLPYRDFFMNLRAESDVDQQTEDESEED